MNITPFQALACPLDGAPLHCTGSTWRCAAGHSFDIASQGYTNLLPVQNKRSRDPGDSKAMVAARRRFLTAGFYQPIAAAVNQATLADLPLSATASCLDAGCGEGYYLRSWPPRPVMNKHWHCSGWISPSGPSSQRRNRISDPPGSWAATPTCRCSRARSIACCAFSASPFMPNSRACLSQTASCYRSMPGRIICANCAKSSIPSLKPERAADRQSPEGFTHLSTDTVRYHLDLTGAEQIADLLAMTPHLYRANAEGRAKAAALTALSVTVDVRLTRFGRDIR